MAKKGLRYVAFGKLQSNGTYSDGVHLSPAASLSGNANVADVKDYGDDRIVETDKSVTGGTLTVELNNDDDDLYTYLLGHTKDQTSEEIDHSVDDVAPFVGVGCIGQSGSAWVSKLYKKVQFAEPNDENNTKEENVSFNHITLEGDILIPEDGSWKTRKTFTTLAAAKTWLNTKLGVSEPEGATGATGET